MRKIEVCCTSVEDVMEAHLGGAIRIELCSAISCGGVTPSHGLTEEVIAEAGRKQGPAVNVLIRPREGSFVYSESEVRTMLSDIAFCRKAGADGVVIGALTPDGDIDIDNAGRLIAAAGEMSVTFHRAFDVCRDPYTALEQIIDLGCDRLLTSGRKPDALAGANLISELVRQAGKRIIIMPGSGINPSNISMIESITGASEFHSTARAAVPDPDRHHVPELGFDEPEAGMEHGVRHILRTSRDVVMRMVSDA